MEKLKKLKVNKKMTGVILIAVLILAAVGFYVVQQGNAKLVEAEQVSKGTVQKLIKETGTVESDASSLVSAKSVMEIKALNFKEGDSVKAGQVILNTDVTAAQLTVKSMEAEAASLRISYNRAREIADQSKLLLSQGAISQDEYDSAAAARDQLAAQVSSLSYSIASMRESMDAGGITAPIDGVITEVYVKTGDTIQPASPILEISDLSLLFLSTNLIASDADRIKTGAKVLVYTKDAGTIDDKAFVRKIYLTAFDLVSDLGISQKRVRVEIAVSDGSKLRIGNTMNVDITVEMRENVLMVSKKAVFELNQKNHVYVMEKGKAVLRQVELGLKGEDTWEVLSGLTEGDSVIISPDNAISDGTRVKS